MFSLVDEAKKEFPYTIEMKDHETIDGRYNQPLFRWQNEVTQWFLKWFGGETNNGKL